ncbi:ABC transporter ATP-binding protein [Actinomadura sp. NPDC048394]|uniref:ABC transporter ATP-binding protein n=1 Tax=Actinomadura sp. NPDC048394 TaxID=3158223 RepID=UPI003406998A
MTPVIETEGLGMRYGRRVALTDCTLRVPAGKVAGFVGPNGAGKSTFLGMVAGLLAPTSGRIAVLGHRPGGGAARLADVAFVAQDAPLYPYMTVADHLRFGARLNPRWDGPYARARIDRLGLDPAQKAGRLSGGQRAQLALTLAAAKRARLLVLDEPVASLDPLARRTFLEDLQETVAEVEVSVMLSSHLLGDLQRVCDHLIVLSAGRVQLAGDVPALLAGHSRSDGERIVPRPDGRPVDLEDLVLAYMAGEVVR